MAVGPTKAVEMCMSALVLARRVRVTVGSIIRATDLVISRRLAVADRLREVQGHIAAARDLHGEDQEAELQRAENGIRLLVVSEIQGEDMEPAFHLRRSFVEHDEAMGRFCAGLERALTGTPAYEASSVTLHAREAGRSIRAAVARWWRSLR